MDNAITIILSSTVISAVITASITFLINKRKDVVENIVKERKTWRDEIREISIDITDSKNLIELKNAINKLKVRINPYGMCKEIVFYDSYIWKEITKLENCNQLSKNELERRKIIFIDLISCLLKFDWERSKNEIKGNIQTKLVITSLCAGFVIDSILWFCNCTFETENIINYISYCTVYFIFVVLSLLVIYWADKWKNRKQFSAYILLTVMFAIVIFMLWSKVSFSDFLLNSATHWIAFLMPLLTLLYCVETKVITYKQNVKFYILSSMIIVGETKISIKYKMFFRKSDKFPSGKKVEFER